MNAIGYIKNKVFVKIKPSKVAGIGLFALRDIPVGTYLFEKWKGETGFFSIEERLLKELPKDLYSHIKEVFIYSPDFPKDTNTNIYLTKGCHWIYTTPYYFCNSGGSNANLDKDTFLTLRDIKAGEEILSNYGRYERIKKELL